ncbi:hypothetical protein Vretifemale_17644, partial [Volvox reticuliferus]
ARWTSVTASSLVGFTDLRTMQSLFEVSKLPTSASAALPTAADEALLPTPSSHKSSSKRPIPVIVGVALGGGFTLVAIIAVSAYLITRRRRQQKAGQGSSIIRIYVRNRR